MGMTEEVEKMEDRYLFKAKRLDNHDPDFVYEVGKIVTAPNFWENRWEECAPGIRFFINRQEAVEY